MYSDKEIKEIREWLVDIGRPDLYPDDVDEYAVGQLLIASKVINCINDYDEWQHIQIMTGVTIPYIKAKNIINMLRENGIMPLELKTEIGDKYIEQRDTTLYKVSVVKYGHAYVRVKSECDLLAAERKLSDSDFEWEKREFGDAEEIENGK